MFARQMTLGRVVIGLAGLVVLAAVVAQRIPPSEQPAAWAAACAAAALGFIALLLIGRALGARAAARLGQDHKAGRLTGVGLAIGLPIILYTTWRWFGGG